MGVSWMFQGWFKHVLKKLQGYFKRTSTVYTRKFPECSKKVSRLFQGNFDNVSKVFQSSFKEVLFSNFAWHSSLLPEQRRRACITRRDKGVRGLITNNPLVNQG